MKKDSVDEAIDLYVTERMVRGKESASSHFLACIYLKQQRWEIAEYLQRICGMTRYYIDLATVTRNPFKGPEIAWLGTMLCLAAYAVMLISMEEQRTLGILLLSGVMVNACYLMRRVAAKWCELHVMVAIYDEIVQITEHELESMA
ncbi:hypothetical protein GMST_30920 [Geomonas silvestris]|uniref:Uncharacterized protein n=1 Tax=Geomonas silvestris TaxID=2740184 RepID=A0A6V8MLN1_9BACT|nr:hypothetical protein [Geomonas silvestris]GFO60767.1 hypothetical protein GMST_30920 [Geomonas silvestris]